MKIDVSVLFFLLSIASFNVFGFSEAHVKVSFKTKLRNRQRSKELAIKVENNNAKQMGKVYEINTGNIFCSTWCHTYQDNGRVSPIS